MSKRFTDSDKWKKPFIRSLEAPYKLLWFYILDDCDHAGIWQVDIEVAQIRIGEKIDVKKAEEYFKDKIIVFNDAEKWLIPDFIEFQYGKLNENNRVHNSVLLQLRKYNLIDNNFKIKGYISSFQGAKDKDMEKEQEKVKEKEQDKEPIIYPFGDEDFIKFWDIWKEFKKEQFRFVYKPIGEQAALKNLGELSLQNKEIAMKIIVQSISNGWKGFFVLKNDFKTGMYDKFREQNLKTMLDGLGKI